MIGHPKPEKRSTTKRRAKRLHGDHVAEIRTYVFGRERGVCRCCRFRPAASMHELRPRSLGGRVSKKNSVAVCGSGTSGCHGFLQSLQIVWDASVELGAEDRILFTPSTRIAAEHLKLSVGQTLVSEPMRAMEIEA